MMEEEAKKKKLMRKKMILFSLYQRANKIQKKQTILKARMKIKTTNREKIDLYSVIK